MIVHASSRAGGVGGLGRFGGSTEGASLIPRGTLKPCISARHRLFYASRQALMGQFSRKKFRPDAGRAGPEYAILGPVSVAAPCEQGICANDI